MADENSTNDAAAVEDSVSVEVKGPDPEVWDTDAPDQLAVAEPLVGFDEIVDEGTPDEIKGPDSKVWEQDSEGNYVNR